MIFIKFVLCSDALTNNGVLVDYLHLLKGMKAQVDNVQSFLEAHIRLLEDIKANTQQKDDPGQLFTILVNPTCVIVFCLDLS